VDFVVVQLSVFGRGRGREKLPKRKVPDRGGIGTRGMKSKKIKERNEKQKRRKKP